MLYDTYIPYDSMESDSLEAEARWRERLARDQQAVRAMLPHLRQEIENPERDVDSVYQVLRPYYEAVRDLPMTPADLPEIEALCRLVLDRGGLRQNEIQEVLLRLVGATAAPQSVPFLLEMWRYTRRGDHFGPERRQLALWGLARIRHLSQRTGSLPGAPGRPGGLESRGASHRRRPDYRCLPGRSAVGAEGRG